MIGDEAHRIDRLARWARGDEDASTVQHADAFQQASDMREDRFWLGHAAWSAAFAGREHAVVRIDNAVAELAQMRHVVLRLRMRPHVIVHRRDQQYRGLRREKCRRQQIVGLPSRSPRKKVSSRRRDDDHRRAACELDVVECAPRVEQPCVHRMPGKRLERDCADELCRGTRHHDVDGGSRLCQQPREPRRLVAGNSSRDAEEDSGTVVGTN